jgi:hypothetical protein
MDNTDTRDDVSQYPCFQSHSSPPMPRIVLGTWRREWSYCCQRLRSGPHRHLPKQMHEHDSLASRVFHIKQNSPVFAMLFTRFSLDAVRVVAYVDPSVPLREQTPPPLNPAVHVGCTRVHLKSFPTARRHGGSIHPNKQWSQASTSSQPTKYDYKQDHEKVHSNKHSADNTNCDAFT